jgi:hypothetical protein
MQFLRQMQPIQSVFRDIYYKSCLSQSLLQELGGLGFIFDHQNSHNPPACNANFTEYCRALEKSTKHATKIKHDGSRPDEAVTRGNGFDFALTLIEASSWVLLPDEPDRNRIRI